MKWYDLKVNTPPINQTVIAYFPKGNEAGELVATGHEYNGEVISDFPNSTAAYFTATHWMEMPKPPEIPDLSDSDLDDNN